jgi:TPR repeat protein
MPRDKFAPRVSALVSALAGLSVVATGCAQASNAPPAPPVVAPLAAPSASAASGKAPADAVGLYTRACDEGSAMGCNNLGLAYVDGGLGQARDVAKGARLLQRSCDLNPGSMGCTNLGFLLHQGEVLPKDELRALGLLTRACDAESWQGCYWLGEVYAGSERNDPARALQVWERGCKGGDQKSCTGQALFLVLGKGVAKDTKRAVPLLETACKKEVAAACTLLGNLTIEGDGVARDVERAGRLYAKGCADDNAQGCYIYALVCASGRLGEDYVERADTLLRHACDLRWADACAMLASRLEK